MFRTLLSKVKRQYKLSLLKRVIDLRRQLKEANRDLKRYRKSRSFYYSALVSISERRCHNAQEYAKSIVDHGKKSAA